MARELLDQISKPLVDKYLKLRTNEIDVACEQIRPGLDLITTILGSPEPDVAELREGIKSAITALFPKEQSSEISFATDRNDVYYLHFGLAVISDDLAFYFMPEEGKEQRNFVARKKDSGEDFGNRILAGIKRVVENEDSWTQDRKLAQIRQIAETLNPLTMKEQINTLLNLGASQLAANKKAGVPVS